MQRNVVLGTLLGIDVTQFGLLSKYKANAWQAMAERNCAHSDGVILINNCRMSIYNIEFEIKRTLTAKVIEPLWILDLTAQSNGHREGD